MTDNKYKVARPDQGASQIHKGADGLNAQDNNCACNAYASWVNIACSARGEQSSLGYSLNKNEIITLMKSGKTYTAKEISKIFLMPVPEVESTLKLMCKLGEVDADYQALTYYRLKK